MEDHSANSGDSRDSFEMYESTKKVDINGEGHVGEGTLSGAGAPGSPRSLLEYRQTMSSMQREIEERKKREADLLNLLRTTQTSPGPLLSDPLLINIEDSLSNENLEENVKDGHIKFLRRQVTVLQANLYKYEGLSSRMLAVTKERDETLSELLNVKSENAILVEKNRILQKEINNIEINYQRKLQQHQAEMEALLHQSAVSNDLMLNASGNEMLLEELDKCKAENKTLKESLFRLEAEFKNFKDYSLSVASNSQSIGNVACSQELEYLHKVVDTLKATVLEQRQFLLSMRSPNTNSSGKDSFNINIPEASLKKSLTVGSGPDFSVKKVTVIQQSLPKSPLLMNKSVYGREEIGVYGREESGDNIADVRGLTEFKQLGLTSNVSEVAAEGFRIDPNEKLMLQNSLNVTPRGSNPSVDPQKSSAKPQNLPQSSGDQKKQAAAGVAIGNGYVSMYPPYHKVSQSEILRVAEEQPSGQPFVRSKSVTIAHNHDYVNTPNWQGKPTFNTSSNVSNALGFNPRNGQSPLPTSYELHKVAKEESVKPQQPPRLQGITPARTEAAHNNPQQVSRTPAPLPPPPLAHRPKPQNTEGAHLYANATEQSQGDTTIKSGGQQISDRLCPMCNKDFSMMSMEEYQTHVFRCFDDDEAPETMKPQDNTGRVCPVCGLTFSSTMSQAEYEKHVHDHFDDDNHMENYEILHP